MSSFQKATATHIWQNLVGEEFEAPFSFLWENVESMEGPQGSETPWESQAPKTVIRFIDGTQIYVLGKFEKWSQRWDRYLEGFENNTLLFTRN